MSIQITTSIQIPILIQITNILQRSAAMVLLNEGRAANGAAAQGEEEMPAEWVGWGGQGQGQEAGRDARGSGVNSGPAREF